ncbi:MAG: AzlC family ABC transporter permease [Lachnospiraceae bacterium]|nr:AzlC family ABC transporter permease [Lachnospiraceae bacterium]
MRDGIPIALGYLAVSFTFGMMAVKDHIGILQAVIISLTNVTSAGQFAGLDIIVAGGSLIEMALTQLIINLRYSLMSISLSQKLQKGTGTGKRLLLAYSVTDEIFGVSAARKGKLNIFYSYGAIAVAVPGWVLGTALGAISGSIMPAFLMSAFSVAIYGMFLAIIIPPAKENKAVLGVVLAAMALASAFAYVPGMKKISSGFAIIIVTLLVSAIAAILHPHVEEEEVSSHA